MEHVHRQRILYPKGRLTPGSVLSAILIGGIVVLLTCQSAYTQVGQEANRVFVGAAAFGDWHNDDPGSPAANHRAGSTGDREGRAEHSRGSSYTCRSETASSAGLLR
jgi:hypothetical protein